jgi:hypothetical protein
LGQRLNACPQGIDRIMASHDGSTPSLRTRETRMPP